MKSVVVFDYGFGNVRSMVRALQALDLEVTLTSDYKQSFEADGLVVPGVGAFAACMQGLLQAGGSRVIAERLADNRPVLGVCVGQQVMFERGIEHGIEAQGLGYFGGSVTGLDADVVPHMGWNTVEASEQSNLLRGLEGERFYFVHSYATAADNVTEPCNAPVALPDAPAVSTCTYGRRAFVAAIEQGALSATQFHPEKSAMAGAQLLRNWAGLL